MTIQKTVKTVKTTTTLYEVTIPHAGLINVKNILDDLTDIPLSANLCGFDDGSDCGTLTFRHQHIEENDDG